MRRADTSSRLTDAEIAAVEALVRDVEAAGGQRAVDGRRFAEAVLGDGRHVVGVAAWEPGGQRPVAYVQAARGERRWDLELVVDPARRGDRPTVGGPVLAAALDAVRAGGGGPAQLWLPGPTDADDRMARVAGLAPDRDLLQLVRPLPAAPEWSLATRPFVPGRDEPAWVEVNNRAFDWHPEQGGWTVDDLLDRERQPWFDPEGFLLHERDGRLAGFCWTKVHDRHDPPLGEIYVIAVDPDFARLGLGRALTLAGLDHLARRGLTVGMLYVDAANAPAVRLYQDLGFTLDHVDRAYPADVPPPPDLPPKVTA